MYHVDLFGCSKYACVAPEAIRGVFAYREGNPSLFDCINQEVLLRAKAQYLRIQALPALG